MEAPHLHEHAEEVQVERAARLCEQTPQATAAGVLEAAAVAAHAHAHLGAPDLHVELREELAQPGIGDVVENDEPAVNGMLPTVDVGDVVGVCMATEACPRPRTG